MIVLHVVANDRAANYYQSLLAMLLITIADILSMQSAAVYNCHPIVLGSAMVSASVIQ